MLPIIELTAGPGDDPLWRLTVDGEPFDETTDGVVCRSDSADYVKTRAANEIEHRGDLRIKGWDEKPGTDGCVWIARGVKLVNAVIFVDALGQDREYICRNGVEAQQIISAWELELPSIMIDEPYPAGCQGHGGTVVSAKTYVRAARCLSITHAVAELPAPIPGEPAAAMKGLMEHLEASVSAADLMREPDFPEPGQAAIVAASSAFIAYLIDVLMIVAPDKADKIMADLYEFAPQGEGVMAWAQEKLTNLRSAADA